MKGRRASGPGPWRRRGFAAAAQTFGHKAALFGAGSFPVGRRNERGAGRGDKGVLPERMAEVVDPSDGVVAEVKSLRRYARALTGDPELADDLVQETLRRALTYRQAGKEIRDLRAYLFTILHNVRVDNLARKSRWGNVVPIGEGTPQLSAPATQDLSVEYREVVDALAKLSEDQRAVILLIGLEGHSYKDTAEILGIPLGTVMSRLSRAREALRGLLETRTAGSERRAV